MFAASAQSTDGIGNSITPQSFVVVNGQFDRAFAQKRISQSARTASPWGNVTEDTASMHKHELCMMYTDAATMPRGHSGGINDPNLRMFTSANGIPVSSEIKAGSKTETEMMQEAGNWTTLRRILRSRMSFIGVNLTTMPSVSTGNTHSSCVVAGAVTTINTGNAVLDIGSRVVWDLPFFDSDDRSGQCVASYGSPQQKKLFMTLPYDKELASSVGSALQYIEDKKDSDQDAKEAFNLIAAYESAAAKGSSSNISARAQLQELLKGLVEIQKELDFRVIGTALTRAKPGEPFDLLLRYNRMA